MSAEANEITEATPLLDYLQREAQDDFDSDGDDWESQEPQLVASPQKMSRREEMEMEMETSPLPTNKTTQELLQEIGRKNRGVSRRNCQRQAVRQD